MAESFTGRLLVATPGLADPNFNRTVVLILEHGEEGALGLVLNRPSGMEVAEPLPQWERHAAEPPSVFIGGPVAADAVICLARISPGFEVEGCKQLFEGLGTLDVTRGPDHFGAEVYEIRVFSGYAGWAGGQLESEIAAGGWFVLDAQPTDAFNADPAGLWSGVLRRQQGSLALVATFPPDPSLN